MANLVSDVLARAAITDPSTGLVSRPWLLFFQTLLTRAGGPGTQYTATDLAEFIEDEAINALFLSEAPAAEPVPSLLTSLRPPESAEVDPDSLVPLLVVSESPLEPCVAATLEPLANAPLLSNLAAGLQAEVRALLATVQQQLDMVESGLLFVPPPLPSVQARHVSSGAAPTVAPVAAGAGANATASLVGTDEAGTITLVCSALDTPLGNNDVLTVTFSAAYAAAPIVLFSAANDAAWNLAYGVLRCRQADTTTALWKLRSGGVPLPALTAGTYLYDYHVIG